MKEFRAFFYFIKEKADRLLSHSMTLEYIFLLPFPSVWSNFLWSNKKGGPFMDVGLNAGLFGLSFLSFFLKYAPRFWSQKVVYGKHGCFFFFSNSIRSPFFFIMLLEHLFFQS
jgi:hypothetical protein